MTSVGRAGEEARIGQLLCAWCAPIAMIMILSGLWAAGFLPPPSPSLSELEIQAFYQLNSLAIRAGGILLMCGCAFSYPFIAAISAQMMRMRGRPAALAATQLITGALSFVPPFITGLVWCAGAFRAELSASDVRLMNDIGWFFLLMPTPAASLQLGALGIAILCDDKAQPVFPRWLAYFNFWVAIFYLPCATVALFKTGPFAWDGLFGFWVPLVVFGAWMMIMFYMLASDARRGVAAAAPSS
ncbi:MAG TPA: hypothetical protein VHK24_02580 [Steroidobacter sp.]|jgi:hypothetical protein|nr:hypothetical protein [Steroidobacter sp.]